jgi:hypothetical protein
MGLDALWLALVLLEVSVLDWCWLWWFLASLLPMIYRNTQGWDIKITAMYGGAKSNMPHDREQLNHLNPYKLFTKLPLAFLVF